SNVDQPTPDPLANSHQSVSTSEAEFEIMITLKPIPFLADSLIDTRPRLVGVTSSATVAHVAQFLVQKHLPHVDLKVSCGSDWTHPFTLYLETESYVHQPLVGNLTLARVLQLANQYRVGQHLAPDTGKMTLFYTYDPDLAVHLPTKKL